MPTNTVLFFRDDKLPIKPIMMFRYSVAVRYQLRFDYSHARLRFFIRQGSIIARKLARTDGH